MEVDAVRCAEIRVQVLTAVSLVTNASAMPMSNHLKKSVPFITVGCGDCQCGKNACKADDTIAMETTIGLFFGRAIAKSSPVAKKFAALRTGKEA